MKEFVHLHLHSEYSLLDGACRIKDLVKKAKELNQPAVAITDHGVMYGVIDFYKECKKQGVKPIIGCEVYVSPRANTDKTYETDSVIYHLVLLCKNETGYKNLIHLVSDAHVNGFYKKPRIDMEKLRLHSSGLIALSACLAGKIPRLILENKFDEAYNETLLYKEIFGDDFYLEVQDHKIAEQKKVVREIYKIAKKTNTKVVATNDVHYLTREDSYNQKVLMCIQMGKTIDDPSKMEFETQEFYMKTYDEMLELFDEQTLDNTIEIANKCNLEFDFNSHHLPKFNVPNGISALEYLKKLCNKGLKERFKDDYLKYQERLDFEIDMIEKMGFIDYFLIVADFIAYAKNNDIPVGPGRGSAAGSMVAYVLKITDIDPVKYSLYFERFLNPERISMPDIDIDFCYVKRPLVIDYVNRKYGKEKVAQIITFGTMAARAAVRDVGRALNIPYGAVDSIAKMIPPDLGITLENALEMSAELKIACDNDLDIKNLLDTAKALEGMPRHASTHAAGVVITEENVDELVPLAKNDEQIVTQFTMTTLEELGLLKVDFLGLRNLTVIYDCIQNIKLTNINFSEDDIPLDDKATFEMLSQGKTEGIFQLESTGITNVVTGLKPESIEDITAIVALYRPGPMQSIPKYIKGKHNPSLVTLQTKQLEEILSVTYGCIVYQEQVMDIFRKLAGYSLGRADIVRRAMSKKKFDALNSEKQNFIFGNEQENIAGCVKNGISKEIANEIFDEILDFANYAFNKAHAVSYAFTSYKTAYLKCHYEKEYMAALLTSVLHTPSKVASYIAATKNDGITVLNPSINYSYADFSVVGDDIRFGLVAIRNVGRTFIENLVREREKNGLFTSFEDFLNRMYEFDLNKRAVEALIKSGAFDEFSYKRAGLLRVYEIALEDISKTFKKNIDGQIDLFAIDNKQQSIKIPIVEEFSKKELLFMEKEMTGIYISGHPLDEFTKVLNSNNQIAKIQDIVDDLTNENPYYKDGMTVFVCGILSKVRIQLTKKNQHMAFTNIEDLTSTLELVIFPKVLEKNQSFVANDNAVIVKGKINFREDEGAKILVDDIKPLNFEYLEEFFPPKENKIKYKTKTLWLKIDNLKNENIPLVKNVLQANKGYLPVKIYLTDEEKIISLSHKYSTLATSAILVDLREILGEDNVIIK